MGWQGTVNVAPAWSPGTTGTEAIDCGGGSMPSAVAETCG